MEPSCKVILQCRLTLLFSVATVARILLADRWVIFSLVKPRKGTRGWCIEGFYESTKHYLCICNCRL